MTDPAQTRLTLANNQTQPDRSSIAPLIHEASQLIENAAYDLAGEIDRLKVADLILIANRLSRMAEEIADIPTDHHHG